MNRVTDNKRGMKWTGDSFCRVLSVCLISVWLTLSLLFSGLVSAEVLERVVAVVNDEVILLSDFQKELSSREAAAPGLSEAEVLDDMVNSLLLLQEARKFRLNNTAANTEVSIVALYIERVIKSLIHVPYEEIEAYYAANGELYGDREFYDVKDDIETILIEQELKIRMLRHTEELRARSYIRIQLEDSD